MKTYLTILCVFCFEFIYAQSSIFTAALIADASSIISGGYIVFPLRHDSLKIVNNDTAVIDLKRRENWIFYFTWTGWNSRIFKFDTDATSEDIQKIILPDRIFFQAFRRQHLCPICLKSDLLVPVVYSMPSKELIKKMKRGEIFLSDCTQFDYSPEVYCKRDGFGF